MKYDIEKIKYDLAIVYAKSKLDHALATNSVPEPCDPEDPACAGELEYLADEFYYAMNTFANFDDSVFIDETDS